MDANNLLNYLITRFVLKNDAALAKALAVSRPAISKLRHGHSSLSPAILILIHEHFDISVRDLRFIAGDFREHTGHSAKILTRAEVKKLGFAVPAHRTIPKFSPSRRTHVEKRLNASVTVHQ